MTSFEIADCPTSVTLAETADGAEKVQKGSLTLTVRNRLDRGRTARIGVDPAEGAKAEWFCFEGAPATSPRELERDFQGKGSATLRLVVRVPKGEAPGSHVVRVRVTAEDDPDNDFTVGPNVAFEVKAWQAEPAPPPPDKWPWWLPYAAAAMVVLVAGIAGYFLFWPETRRVPQMVGEVWEPTAKALLSAQKVSFDPPVTIQLPRGNQLIGRVIMVDPGENQVVPKGRKVVVTIGSAPPIDPPPGGGCRPPLCRPWENLDVLTRDRLEREVITINRRNPNLTIPNITLPR